MKPKPIKIKNIVALHECLSTQFEEWSYMIAHPNDITEVNFYRSNKNRFESDIIKLPPELACLLFKPHGTTIDGKPHHTKETALTALAPALRQSKIEKALA